MAQPSKLTLVAECSRDKCEVVRGPTFELQLLSNYPYNFDIDLVFLHKLNRSLDIESTSTVSTVLATPRRR